MPIRPLFTGPALALVALALPALAQSQALPPLDEAEAALMQVFLMGTPLGDGLQAFPGSKHALVPLGEICRLVQFAIDVQGDRGRAEGFFIEQGRRFSLDLATHTVEAGGRKSTFEPWQVRALGRELYVDTALLEQWFPLEAKAVFRESSLYLKSKEPLPVEAAWEREKRASRMLGAGSGPGANKGPRPPFPYTFFSLPVMEGSLSWGRSQSGPSRPPTGSMSAAGDLLWMSSFLYANRDSDGSWRNSRASLFREDPDGGLLGPLHARQVAVGDIQRSVSLELMGSLPQGRGLLVDNYPTAYRSGFGMRAFRGPIPQGWTVELFQNGGLIGFQTGRADGQYEFPSVQLNFGLNLFRLVFHGPQGQRREETHRLDISQDMPEPGAFHYRLAALEPTLPPLQADPESGTPILLRQPLYFAEGEAGLGTRLAIKAGGARLQFQDAARTYGVAGLRTLLPHVSLDLTGAFSKVAPLAGLPPKAQGSGLEAALRTGIGYSGLTLRRAEYRNGFQPLGYLSLGRANLSLRSDTQASLNTSLPWGRSPVSLSYTYQERGYAEGRQRSQRLQAGASLGPVSFSPAIGLTQDNTLGRPSRLLEGQILLTTFVGATSLQSDIQGFRQDGKTRLSHWAFNASQRLTSGLVLQGGLRGGVGGLRQASAYVSVLQQAGRFSYGLDASYAKNAGGSIGFRVQAALAREPRTHRWFTDAQPLSSLGLLSARAFVDSNGNGEADPGERVLDDVQFSAGDATREEWRPDPKVAVYTQLPRGLDLQLQVDAASLEETTLHPAVPALTIRPRGGTWQQVDYPVVILGEVLGTLRLRKAARPEELAGVDVELASLQGGKTFTTRSAFDGFFEFVKIPPGTYQLRVSPKESLRVGLKQSEGRRLDITTTRSLFEGQDLLVDPLVPKTPPSETAPAAKPPVAATAPTAAQPLTKAPAMASTAPGPGNTPPTAEPCWTIALVVAQKKETLDRARLALRGSEAELFVLPLPGSTRSRICLGRFERSADAEARLKSLPSHFFSGGNRPHLFRL